MARTHSWVGRALAGLALAGVFSTQALAQTSFVTFESGQVRPLALSPDGTRLYAVNTPDNNLEIFSVGSSGLTKLSSISVGLEPVAVAVRTSTEVWVVNHLSDSVSIVDLSLTPPRVTRTLLVGDEPRDILFAGTGDNRAFITTAHRGQHRTDGSISGVTGAGDPQLTTEDIGRADVWVFDATALGSSMGGTPDAIVTLFGDTPRALAVTPDGSTVYAAIFKSGNQTMALSEGAVCNGFGTAAPCVVQGQTMPGGLPPPSTNAFNQNAPETGLIVRYDPVLEEWRDELATTGELVEYVPNFAYIVGLTEPARQSLAATSYVHWVGAYHPGYKLHPDLVDGDMMVRFFPGRADAGWAAQ